MNARPYLLTSTSTCDNNDDPSISPEQLRRRNTSSVFASLDPNIYPLTPPLETPGSKDWESAFLEQFLRASISTGGKAEEERSSIPGNPPLRTPGFKDWESAFLERSLRASALEEEEEGEAGPKYPCVPPPTPALSTPPKTRPKLSCCQSRRSSSFDEAYSTASPIQRHDSIVRATRSDSGVCMVATTPIENGKPQDTGCLSQNESDIFASGFEKATATIAGLDSSRISRMRESLDEYRLPN